MQSIPNIHLGQLMQVLYNDHIPNWSFIADELGLHPNTIYNMRDGGAVSVPTYIKVVNYALPLVGSERVRQCIIRPPEE